MEDTVVIALIAIAVIASGVFVFSLASMGSKCSRAEEATYREYLLSKQRNEDNENKNREEDQ